MPVALEIQAMRGGPPPSMLSHEGIARLRLHAIRQSQQNYQLHTNATTLMRDQWLVIDTLSGCASLTSIWRACSISPVVDSRRPFRISASRRPVPDRDAHGPRLDRHAHERGRQ